MRRNDDARVLGPYAEKDRWRLVILEKGVRRSEYLATEKEAQKRKAQLTKRMESLQEYTVNSLITAYTEEKERLGTALPLTCKSHAASLRIMLAPILEKTVISLTPAAAERLYAELIGTPNARTGRPVAIATHRFYLATARHMFGWAVKKGFITTNPFGAVTPVGKPKAGKKQLRIEEARLFIEAALKRYEKKRKPILLAAVMALTMGLRASEILKRQVRDLDDGCGILWIDQGKTHNARRHLRIPEFLRPLLQELIKGKGPESFLFPSELPGQSARRQRLWAVVQDICKRAGVTRVCAHSLRGLYATLAVESGALSETVAASLGHGSFSMTEKHYAQQSSISNVKTARVESMLTSQRSTDGTPTDAMAKLLSTLGPEQRAQLMALLHQKEEIAAPN